MIVKRRGMGETCASLGPLPGGYLCSDATGSPVLQQVGAVPAVVNVSASGVNTLLGSGLDAQVQTCVEAGGSLTDCIAAVISVNTSSSGLPSWALPVGIGVLGLLLIKAFTR
jgi:hypothetical protein